MDAKDQAQAAARHSGLAPGQIYRHYKGGLYTVVAVAIQEDTLEPVVVYHSNARGTTWVRTLADWDAPVDLGTEYVRPDGTRHWGRARFSRVRD